jgi:uracil-DNA glycosylase
MKLGRNLRELQAFIRGCTRCVEAGYLETANPIVRGQPGAQGMLVGQAPGPRADRTGTPWAGASGNLMRRWFARAGFDPSRFLDEWYFTAVTRCYPGPARNGPGDRVASAPERALCRPHLEAELALVRPALIMTIGRLATEAFVPGAKGKTLDAIVGEIHTIDLGWGPVLLVPLPHPSGVGRWLNQPANRERVDAVMDALGARLGRQPFEDSAQRRPTADV